jgi:V/A-type H+-transporting ATPase subunit F
LKEIVFITPPDAEYGFSLTGVTQYSVNAEESEDMLKKIMADPDTGVVVVDERLIKDIPEERLKRMEEGWQGVLLALPAPERAGIEVEDYAVRLIKRAIGYHVRLSV